MFNSLLSLSPLVAVLKKMISEGKPGAKLYQGLIREIESIPGLLEPTYDISTFANDNELVETLLSTIFPPSSSSNQGMYAITKPFMPETIYASPGFKQHFLKEPGTVDFSGSGSIEEINKAIICLAYDLILKKYYAHNVPVTTTSVHAFRNENGLTSYYELKMNAQFVEVSCINRNFTAPHDFEPRKTLQPEELMKMFPLDNFRFEGLLVIEMNDVTNDRVMVEIKSALLNINSFSEVAVYDQLQQHVQSLLGLKQVQIGITPFFRMNGFYIYTESLYKNSLLFKPDAAKRNKDKISEQCQEVFGEPVLYEILNEASTLHKNVLKYYFEQGAKSLLIFPLKTEDGKLIGLLEVLSLKPSQLQMHHMNRIQPAIPLFTLALQKSVETLELQIDKMIKEHFTAIQPSVEWKFTEAAFQYLQHRQISEMAKMPMIKFDDVYPLYAAIDVRNSSSERNHSIQLDLLEQLNMAKGVLQKAIKVVNFPLLKETQFRIEKYISSIEETLLSDEEMLIYDFLENDLDSLFKNLRKSKPELTKWINEYYAELDPQRGVIYHNRKDFEESITRINDVLDRFIDNEQREAQDIYPHYFERYVTDGIEFNIYIGQSLSPQYPFDEMYLRNLKLWQLHILARAAKVAYSLEQKLSLPLQTTQLVLAHSIPLSISFRRKERKFDVDGAYNIRYEIMKKRIDKVRIRDSEERLTQPGTISIVYSQNKELEEYSEFIEYLQHEKMLGTKVEHLELEDTQGISGLKAIRVDILLNEETPNQKIELSKTMSRDLVHR